MKKLTVLVTGDWHLDSKEYNVIKAELSLKEMVEYCKKNEVDLILNPGDVWEKAQIDPFYDSTMGAGVELARKYLSELSKSVTQIFIVKGNNSHDPVGSIAKLHKFRDNIFAYEYPVVLGIDETNFVVDLLRNENKNPLKFIVTLIPYPTKQGFVTIDSIDNNNAEFIEKFEEFMAHIGTVVEPYDCPKIMGLHGNVVGSRLSSGQTLVSQDVLLAPKTLERALHHYYGLGHIHLRQFFSPYMGYCGSLYNKNWGETEQKSFEVVTFELDTNDDWDFESKQVMFESGKPMLKIEADYIAGDVISQPEGINIFDQVFDAFEYRLRITVKENDRKLITDDEILRIKEHFGDVKIEFNMVPDDRESRSENIMKCATIYEEVKEFAKVVEFELPDSIQDKVLIIETEMGVKK